jgi:hypothetical protein
MLNEEPTEAVELVRRIIARGFDLNECAMLHHEREPGASLESYVNKQLQSLNTHLIAKAKIYLDTKYWILLRDVKLKRTFEQVHIKFSELLHQLVACGKVICPVSAPNLFEVLRQQDQESRIATVQLMDVLSTGVCLRSQLDRGIDDFVRAILEITQHRSPNLRLDFDFISHILGFIPLRVDSSKLVVASPLAYAKASYDMGKFTTLEDIQPGLDADSPFTIARLPDNSEWAEEMNRYKAALKGRHFKLTRTTEFIGGLEASSPRLRMAMEKIYQIEFDRLPTEAECGILNGKIESFISLFKRLYSSQKIPIALLPQIHIQATIFAKVLTENIREITRTDFDDVCHVTDALPSCNLFFTENYFCHLLSHPPGNLSHEFNVTVVSKLEDAIDALKKVS